MVDAKIVSLASLHKPQVRSGFTLIELSIVLVIIGLMAGGILAGQDLIKAATIRKAVSDLEKISTGINTFKLKYNCIPGDCANTTDFFPSSTFMGGAWGIPPYTTTGNQIGNGDGNGLIDGGNCANSSSNPANWYCEPYVALQSLLAANLIPQTMIAGPYLRGYNDTMAWLYYADWYGVTQGYTQDGSNLAALTQPGITVGWGTFTSNYNLINGPAISPNDARRIDEKIDDGLPKTGRFFGLDAPATGSSDASLILPTCWVSGQNSYQNSDVWGCRVVYYIQKF